MNVNCYAMMSRVVMPDPIQGKETVTAMKYMFSFCTKVIPICYVLISLVGLTSCDFNRSVYEAMQNVKEQQCLDDPSRNSPECLERESYDAYERKMQSSKH